MKLYNFQTSAIEQVKNKKNVLFAYDMGLGKTYLGARRLIDKNKKTSLVICQKSKIND
jgi:superfamily II DNA or RNA helicase